MDRAAFLKGLAGLNAPNQGMSYHSGGIRRGGPEYDQYTGKRIVPPSEPATLNVYGERARFLHDVIRGAEELFAALSSEEPPVRPTNRSAGNLPPDEPLNPHQPKGGETAEPVATDWETWCKAWHRAVETILTIYGLSPALGATEAAEAMRERLYASPVREPVAWRTRHSDKDWFPWSYFDDPAEVEFFNKSERYQLEPLYASPAPSLDREAAIGMLRGFLIATDDGWPLHDDATPAEVIDAIIALLLPEVEGGAK